MYILCVAQKFTWKSIWDRRVNVKFIAMCNIPSRFINCDFFVSVSIGWFSLHTAGLYNCPNPTRSTIDIAVRSLVSLHLRYNSVARAFRAIRWCYKSMSSPELWSGFDTIAKRKTNASRQIADWHGECYKSSSDGWSSVEFCVIPIARYRASFVA